MIRTAMIREFAFACALLAPVAAQAQAPSPAQMQPSLQFAGPLPDKGLPKPGATAPHLQEIGMAVQKLMQQMQAYGAQQKSNPQTIAMLQVMLLQAESMRNVAAILLQQSQAQTKISPVEKMKQTAALKAAADAAPVAAKQKDMTTQKLVDMQSKFDEAVKKLEQVEKTKSQKDQAPLVMFQTALLQVQARLHTIMLAELGN